MGAIKSSAFSRDRTVMVWSPQNDTAIYIAKCFEGSKGIHEIAQISFDCDGEREKSLNLSLMWVVSISKSGVYSLDYMELICFT